MTVNGINGIIAVSIIIILGLGLIIFECLYFNAKKKIKDLEKKSIKDGLKEGKK